MQQKPLKNKSGINKKNKEKPKDTEPPKEEKPNTCSRPALGIEQKMQEM